MKSILHIFSNQRLSNTLLVVMMFVVCTTFGQTITRTQIHNNARPFTTYTFTASSANIQSGTSCPSAGGGVTTPAWVTVGAHTVGMPYCWGGFSSRSSFTSALLTGKSAGDDDCSTSGDCCESCALGVDCSGFVSHAWGLSTKYSTSTLPSISTGYSSAMQVKQGDIFNLAGSHVRLVDTNYYTGSFLLMESSAVDWKVSYRSYTTSQLTSYDPRWYVNVDTSSLVCSKAYAPIPYSTSFENIWVMDTCNYGVQRSPDRYWKSNIGGTTPTGDDYWHRDDYTGADWTTPTNGTYTPSASIGSYSARFHNDPPPSGSTGALDLYINLSPAGTKQVSFDYIHNEASPSPFSFNVLLSSDGGTTFPTTLNSITSAQVSSWTTQTFTTNATSATGVLRFMVTDKGTHDVGIDNLSVGLLSTTGITQIAEDHNELTIFPNPSNGNITVQSLYELGNICIYNPIGEVVLQMQSKNRQEQIDLNNLTNGVYYIKTNRGTQKIIKQ